MSAIPSGISDRWTKHSPASGFFFFPDTVRRASPSDSRCRISASNRTASAQLSGSVSRIRRHSWLSWYGHPMHADRGNTRPG